MLPRKEVVPSSQPEHVAGWNAPKPSDSGVPFHGPASNEGGWSLTKSFKANPEEEKKKKEEGQWWLHVGGEGAKPPTLGESLRRGFVDPLETQIVNDVHGLGESTSKAIIAAWEGPSQRPAPQPQGPSVTSRVVHTAVSWGAKLAGFLFGTGVGLFNDVLRGNGRQSPPNNKQGINPPSGGTRPQSQTEEDVVEGQYTVVEE